MHRVVLAPEAEQALRRTRQRGMDGPPAVAHLLGAGNRAVAAAVQRQVALGVTDGLWGPSDEAGQGKAGPGWGAPVVIPSGAADALRRLLDGGQSGGSASKQGPSAGATQPGGGGGSNGLLRVGSRGPAVADVQSCLCAAGHEVAVDGAFGWGTRGAVVAFQGERGLVADGIVGPLTQAALHGGA